MIRKIIVLMLMICLFLPAEAEEWLVDDSEAYYAPDAREQAAFLMRNMTTEEKVGMLLMVSPEDLTGEKRTERLEEKDCFAKLPAGGVILYGQNISSKEQLKQLCEDIVVCAGQSGLYTPFIAVDEEGGQVIRIANKLGIEPALSAEEIGRTGIISLAYDAGLYTGAYLKGFGVNLDLAPVADVMIEDSPELSTRTYGTNPQLVAEMALEMARGLNDSGVMSCFKHFPGHGTITRNAHNVATGHSRTMEQMRNEELIPFQAAIDKGAQMIMVSHLTARQLDSKHPVSLSVVVIDGLLRKEMGFEGVVITDALRMGAITEKYKEGDAAVLSILAGADMVLAPGSGQECYKALLKAVENGTLSMERLDKSVERILVMKIESGLIQ